MPGDDDTDTDSPDEDEQPVEDLDEELLSEFEVPDEIPTSLNDAYDCMHGIRDLRNNPLLIIYYPENHGYMKTDDVEETYDILNEETDEHLEHLDIVLHSWGGDPHVGYRLPQIIQNFAEETTVIIPHHAFSAATLFCLGCNNIELGPIGAISPIDIKLVGEDEETHLVSIDNYLDLVKEMKEDLEKDDIETSVEESLAVELVNQVGALNLGDLYRRRKLTDYYAHKLLRQHLLSDRDPPVREEISKHIRQQLIYENPAHSFQIDFSMAKEIGIPVDKMDDDVFEQSINLIESLNNAAMDEWICGYIGRGMRDPFIEFIN